MAKFDTVLIGGRWDGKTAKASSGKDGGETGRIDPDQNEYKLCVQVFAERERVPVTESDATTLSTERPEYRILRYERRKFGLNGVVVEAFVADHMNAADAASRLTEIWRQGGIEILSEQLIRVKQGKL